MRTVLLDTIGLIALWDKSDQWHTAADNAYQVLTSSAVRLVTTTLILCECGNAAARRPYRRDVADLWSGLDAVGDLIRPTDAQMNRAWVRYSAAPPGSAGVVDQISFIVMTELGISEAFTNDAHFRVAGFVTLI